MNGLSALLADAGRLRTTAVGANGYALVYGSHAYRSTPSKSDLDLLYVGAPLPDSSLRQLIGNVVAMHRAHGLHLDTEVAYEVKLHADLTEVEDALALRGFTVVENGILRVAPVVVESWFLNSRAFKLRLILNALTTSHVFLGGAVDLYRQHCADADRAVALVALSMLDEIRPFTVADAVGVLVTGPDGATGEDFLGYASGPALHSTVQRGLADLEADRVTHCTDGAAFEQDRQRRRQVIANLSGPVSRRPAGPGTMTT